jgi:ribosomal protein L3 glutamine methyltransferase
MSKAHIKTPVPILSSKAAKELISVCDLVRYAVSKFNETGLFYGHGTDNAFDEAAFMVLEALSLPIDSLEPYWNARLTLAERRRVVDFIHKRVKTRKPASYILNKAYIQGYPFYVDERVIVPRSFIAEILCADGGFPPAGDPSKILSVLDLCTGSGCLAILAAHLYPNAVVDAVDLSADALEVAKINVAEHGLEGRVHLHQGDVFEPIKGRKYDLIITNPPYVDEAGMTDLPPEFEQEPVMALAAGSDGLDIVHRIMAQAKAHLNDGAGVICELGRCGPALEAAYPDKAFQWLETENSSGEVFWLPKSGF